MCTFVVFSPGQGQPVRGLALSYPEGHTMDDRDMRKIGSQVAHAKGTRAGVDPDFYLVHAFSLDDALAAGASYFGPSVKSLRASAQSDRLIEPLSTEGHLHPPAMNEPDSLETVAQRLAVQQEEQDNFGTLYRPDGPFDRDLQKALQAAATFG